VLAIASVIKAGAVFEEVIEVIMPTTSLSCFVFFAA
jgi:hypothetical protein